MIKIEQTYQGFEQGPIRPPSESGSLLIRVTRNCPWNRCTFCGLYKGAPFSQRPVADILRDIDTVHQYVELLRDGQGRGGAGSLPQVDPAMQRDDQMALCAARNWLLAGGKSVFLQDSNSLIIKPDHLVTILRHLKTALSQVSNASPPTPVPRPLARMERWRSGPYRRRRTQPNPYRFGIGLQ